MVKMVRRWLTTVAFGAALGLFAAPIAGAQLCGDADGNGSLNVADGIQALRAVASLSSSCTLERCDVDGSGTLAVADGVGILRKVAGLPAPDNCADITAELEDLLGEVQSGYQVGLALAQAFSASAARFAQDDFCETGTIEIVDQTISFIECVLQGIEIDGDLTVTASEIAFDFFTITDLETGESVTLDGFFEGRVIRDTIIVNGELTISTSDGDEVVLTFQQLNFRILQGGSTETRGSIVIDASGAGSGRIASITLTYDGTDIVGLTVQLNNGQQRCFTFDSATEKVKAGEC